MERGLTRSRESRPRGARSVVVLLVGALVLPAGTASAQTTPARSGTGVSAKERALAKAQREEQARQEQEHDDQAQADLHHCIQVDGSACEAAMDGFEATAKRYYDRIVVVVAHEAEVRKKTGAKSRNSARIYTRIVDYSFDFVTAVTNSLQACEYHLKYMKSGARVVDPTICGISAKKHLELFSAVVREADTHVQGRESLLKVTTILGHLVTYYNPGEPPVAPPKTEPPKKKLPMLVPPPAPRYRGLWAGVGVSAGVFGAAAITSLVLGLQLRRGGPVNQQIAEASNAAGTYDPWSPDLCNDAAAAVAAAGAGAALIEACARHAHMRRSFNAFTFGVLPASAVMIATFRILIARKRARQPSNLSVYPGATPTSAFVHMSLRF